MKNISKLIVGAAAIGAAAGATLAVHYGYSDKEFCRKSFTVNGGKGPLKVGIISDLQLPNINDKTTHQYKSFEKTLDMLKRKGMDALIIGGDFTDAGTVRAWKSYKEIFDNTFSDANKPIMLCVMGNHDYWLPTFWECGELPTPAKQQKRFEKYTGEKPYSHIVINGFHIICWSSSNGSYDKSYQNKVQVRRELDAAVNDAPDKPIFVITHINPANSVYGSDEWGNADVEDVLKDYPQAISMSGHSHYSIIDERSIFQGKYTAFTTQSLDYIELETGKFNGTVPKDAYGNTIADVTPACLYMTVEKDKVTLERLNANDGMTLKNPWVINAPFGNNRDYSNDSRQKANNPPSLPENLNFKILKITDICGNIHNAVSFSAGSDDDFVHSYRLRFFDKDKNPISFYETDYDGNLVKYNLKGERVPLGRDDYNSASPKMTDSVLYFSDYVLGLDKMSDTVLLRLPDNVPHIAAFVEITAIDSWGAESKSSVCNYIRY